VHDVLIENGVLQAAICRTSLNAGLMGVPSTGNGRRESFAMLPMPRMTNTCMLARCVRSGRDHRFGRSVACMRRNFGGGQVDITSGKFVFSASEAYLIENGKITRSGERRTLIGSGPTVLQSHLDGRQRS
jgi:TldD protein